MDTKFARLFLEGLSFQQRERETERQSIRRKTKVRIKVRTIEKSYND